MHMNGYSPSRRLLAVAALTLVAGLAQAQYVWIDAKGTKQFSDRSPPASVREKDILKAPGRPMVAVLTGDAEQPAPAASVAETATKSSPTIAERNVEFNKRISDKAAGDKKAAAAAQAKAAKNEQCAAAREYKVQLDSGARIGTVTQSGERTLMSDADRALANAKANKILGACR